MKRRVKITGIGPVTPAGIGREAFWKGILEPVSRVRPYTGLGDENGPFMAACMSDFDITRFATRDQIPKGASRQSTFAVAGAFLALEDAGILPNQIGEANCAIVIGSSLMDFGSIGRSIAAVHRGGPRAAQPRLVYTANVTGVPEAISHFLDAPVRTVSIQSACCSGVDAIGHATGLVASGAADIALCGGTEAPLFRFPMLEFRVAELTPATSELAPQSARPFDMWRTTGVISEGACIFVLEPESSPRRGYSLVSGYGFANDRDGELCSGLEKAARIALADASRRPCDVDSINAWGPGHKLVDQAEFQAMASMFGERLAEISAVSVKGAVGTALGASGPIQAATAALGQSSGQVPPTVNWEYPDPACRLNLATHARSLEQQVTLVNSHGLGGTNACLVLEPC